MEKYVQTETQMKYKAVLSVNEFCLQAGIGRTMLYQEISSGRLVARKCGRRTIIPVSELNNWLERLPEIGGAE